MTTRRKWIFAGAGVLVVLALGFALRPSKLSVETASATRDSLTVTVAADGKTRVRDRFTIAAPSTGRLQRIALREGAVVEAGDVVARLEPPPRDARNDAEARARASAAEATRSAAAADLSRLSAAATQAAAEASRRQPLVEFGAISREAMEHARLAATAARQEQQAAEARLRVATADLAAARSALLGAGDAGTTTTAAIVEIRSPITGRVLQLPDPSERVVAAGTTLIELGNLAGLEVVIDLLSQDAARVAVGAPVVVTDWGGDQELHGVVTRVDPDAFTKVSALGVEEQRVHVIASLTDMPPTLGAGFRVEARVVTWSGADVLQVPTSALFQGRNGWELFVLEGGRAHLRSVQVGHRSDAAAEITDGLEAGDVVILYPSDELTDGTRAKAVAPAAADAGGR